MTIDDIAREIAGDVVGDEAMGFDPATIAAIIAIISQLIPMIQDCRKDSETSDIAATRIARITKRRGPAGFFYRLRLRNLVRAELGRDAEPELVAAVADAVAEAGCDIEKTTVIFNGT